MRPQTGKHGGCSEGGRVIFSVDTGAFREAIQAAERVIPAKSPWPILTNLKIITNDSRVTLVGNNGDMAIEADIPAEVVTEGVTLVPFASLSKFCAAAKSERIKFAMSDSAVKVTAGRSRITLGAWPSDDYPNYLPPEGEPIPVDKDTFCTALRFAVAAAEDGEVKWHIAGPNFSEVEGGIDIWGTDGTSAHHARIEGLPRIGGGGTLPRSEALTVLALTEKAQAPAFMISQRGWHLAVDNRRLWGKVIDAAFPDVSRISQRFTSWGEVLSASNTDLTQAISVATCGTAEDNLRSRNLVLYSRTGGRVSLHGHKAVGGVLKAGSAEIDAEGRLDYAGAVSAKYLAAAARDMPQDVILERSVDPEKGDTILRLLPNQSSSTLKLTAIIMALRISEAELADVV